MLFDQHVDLARLKGLRNVKLTSVLYIEIILNCLCQYRFFVETASRATYCLAAASSLVASVGYRDQWKNNGSAGLNGKAIATARMNDG